jgi:hypothetical protein
MDRPAKLELKFKTKGPISKQDLIDFVNDELNKEVPVTGAKNGDSITVIVNDVSTQAQHKK